MMPATITYLTPRTLRIHPVGVEEHQLSIPVINLKYRAIDFDYLNYSTSVYSIILKMITTKTRY